MGSESMAFGACTIMFIIDIICICMLCHAMPCPFFPLYTCADSPVITVGKYESVYTKTIGIGIRARIIVIKQGRLPHYTHLTPFQSWLYVGHIYRRPPSLFLLSVVEIKIPTFTLNLCNNSHYVHFTVMVARTLQVH